MKIHSFVNFWNRLKYLRHSRQCEFLNRIINQQWFKRENSSKKFCQKWYLTIWWDFKISQVTLTIIIFFLMLWVWSAMQQLFLWNPIMTYCLLALIKQCHINVFCYFMNISFMWAKINSILKIVNYLLQVYF